MKFKENAEVLTSTGDMVGRIDRVVIDPKSNEVTHLVVKLLLVVFLRVAHLLLVAILFLWICLLTLLLLLLHSLQLLL